MSWYETLTADELLRLTGCNSFEEVIDCIVITGSLSTDPSNLNDLKEKKK